MKVCCVSLLALIFFVSVAVTAEEDRLQRQSAPVPDQVWPLDSGSSEQLRKKGGSVTESAGARNQCLVPNGKSLLEAKNSTAIPDSHKPFTLTIWFKPYNLDRDQQMLAAKNRDSLNEREWGVMVDRDKKLRLYTPVRATHRIPDFAKPVPLWHDTQVLPIGGDIPALQRITFHVIKKWDQKGDGYTFLHGVGFGWHKGKLYTSIMPRAA